VGERVGVGVADGKGVRLDVGEGTGVIVQVAKVVGVRVGSGVGICEPVSEEMRQARRERARRRKMKRNDKKGDCFAPRNNGKGIASGKHLAMTGEEGGGVIGLILAPERMERGIGENS
jgi:hypothetical protein